MRLFGFGKPDPAKLKESGDVAALALALDDRDPVVARGAFEALIEMTIEPSHRHHNQAALEALRKAREGETLARLRTMLDEISPSSSSWKNSATMEALILLGGSNAFEPYYDRHATAGLYNDDLIGLLVRLAAQNRNKPLLMKLLKGKAFSSPESLRLGSSASDAPLAHFSSIQRFVPIQMGMDRVGAVLCELATEDELLEVATVGRASHALPVIFEKLGAIGTETAIHALEGMGERDDGSGRRARATMTAILARLPAERLIALVEKKTPPFVARPALLALCQRVEPTAAELILEAVADPDEAISEAAIKAIAILRPGDAVATLDRLAKLGSGSRSQAAVDALAGIASPAAIDALLGLPPQRLIDEEVFAAIANAGRGAELVRHVSAGLEAMNPGEVLSLIDTLRTAVRCADLEPVQDRIAQAYVEELDHEKWGHQKRSAEVLGRIGGPVALHALKARAARDVDVELGRVLAEAINDAGG